MSETPRIVSTAAALVIGNELLTGKVSDANLQPLASTLRARGVRLVGAHFVGDSRKEIANEVNALRSQVDLVITSGGIGPTHDDVTVEAVADAFGVASVIHPVLAQMLRDVYRERLTEDHLRMALVPEGARLYTNESTGGSRWPSVAKDSVWLMPGIPELFRARLATLKEYVCGPVKYYSRSVLLELEEIEVKPLLDATVAEWPRVEIGSYPRLFSKEYKTQITFDAEDEASVERALAAFVRLLPGGTPHRIPA